MQIMHISYVRASQGIACKCQFCHIKKINMGGGAQKMLSLYYYRLDLRKLISILSFNLELNGGRQLFRSHKIVAGGGVKNKTKAIYSPVDRQRMRYALNGTAVDSGDPSV